MLDSKTWQVIGESKTTKFDFTKKAGFFLETNEGDETPDRPENVQKIFSALKEETPFWQVIIQDYREAHADAVNVINTYSNASVIQAMGALPIQVSVSGYLYTTTTEDHRLDFLTVYNEVFRGTLNWEYDIIVNFFVKDTYMRLFFTRIEVNNNSQLEDMTGISFSGIGFKYRCI